MRALLLRLSGALIACAAAFGCGTLGLSLDELPADPIAVTYWEPEIARRRAELLDEQKVVRRKRGVAEVDAIGRLLGAAGEREGLSRYPGRLAFVDPRTGRVTPVRAAPRGAAPLAWSDDHQRLLFLSNHRGSVQVYEYDRQSGEVRWITTGPNPHMHADYGRGDQITTLEVVSERGREFERVYLSDPSGGSRRLLFEDRNAQVMRLSPDGETLLYVRRVPGDSRRSGPRTDLVALDLDSGTEERRGPGREPSFSPNGDWIVYSAPSRDGWRLRRMRPDGSARSPVTGGIRDETMPSVSPDGRFVVYVGESTGLERLFVRRIDGSGDRILLDVGAVFAPVW